LRCGLAAATAVPCWFANETDIVLSDGVAPRQHRFAWIQRDGVDVTAPLRDAAFVEENKVWLLGSAAQPREGRSVARWLWLAADTGSVVAAVDLEPAARLILHATSTTCWLLTAMGDLMEVSVR
jgi:hypothetical protein